MVVTGLAPAGKLRNERPKSTLTSFGTNLPPNFQVNLNSFPIRSLCSFFTGKVHTILPANVYAKTKAAKSPQGVVHGQGTAKSYDQAAAECRATVEKIAKECRRVNLKYRDQHFDIEADLKRNQRDCLDGLAGSGNDLNPKSVKRVPVSFDPGAVDVGNQPPDIRRISSKTPCSTRRV